jgi:hypothetical protein
VNAFKEIWFWPEEELRRLVWGDVRFKVLLYLSTYAKGSCKAPLERLGRLYCPAYSRE